MRIICLIMSLFWLLFLPVASVSAADANEADSQSPIGDIFSYPFSDWAGPDIKVWAYLPTDTDLRTAPILMLMHGNGRNSASYLRAWKSHAQEAGVIVLAPNFNDEDFSGSRQYNLGHVFDRKGQQRDEADWTFSAIEPVFDQMVGWIGSEQTHYTLYGHSAGSQFVHRFLYFKPEARIKRVLAANAGWYTMPTFDETFPYGLKGSGVTQDALKQVFETDVIILLGDQDIDAQHRSLRRTPEAMAQGPHRFSRGQSFFEQAQKQATDLDATLNWQLVVVPDVAHSNGGIAKTAINYVE